MSEGSSKKTVDVLVGSPRADFFHLVQSILTGYNVYNLIHFPAVEKILEPDDPNCKPVLAIIDGKDGTGPTNEWVQSSKMAFDCPVIVLHTAENPIDFAIVKKNGANHIMHLVYDREFISDMILESAPVVFEDHIPITALMPVDLRDLEKDTEINFDLYVHLPQNQKTLIFRKNGSVMDDKAIQKFNDMKQQMYIKKTERKAFFEYARTVLSMRDIPLPVSMTEKFHRSKRTIFDIMTCFLNGAPADYAVGKEILEQCKVIISENMELIKDMSPKELFDEICRFAGNTRSNYHDAICVAGYAAFFAQLLGMKVEDREKAAMAGLLHNVGLAQMPLTSAGKIENEYSEAEFSEYKQYPIRSEHMVKNKKVPLEPEIALAIGQHRETCDGKGFPKAMQLGSAGQMSKLLAIAYEFHKLTALYQGASAYTPRTAIEHIRNNAMTGTSTHDLITVGQIFKSIQNL